jgi:hypothetical protein
MHAFIDESVAKPENGHLRSFYILAVAYLSPNDFAAARQALLANSASDFMHATELLRSQVGREELLRLCAAVPPSVHIRIFFHEPLLSGDREGEATRVALFQHFLRDLEADPSLDVDEVTYETRRDGYMRQADLRTVRQLAVAFPSVHMRSQTPGTEKLLWIADLAAAAYRQSVLRGNDVFLETFAARPHVVLI